jgi:cytoskeleton protein RodZ
MSESLDRNDTPSAESAPAAPLTAGGLLRQARQARGMHIAALANAMKVTPQKLEALESDRFDELPGATFTRALAQTVCRTLKIDAAPVLALLPSVNGQGLEQMSRGLNEPFRDRPGRQPPTEYLSFLKNPVRLGAIALVVLAVVVYLLPAGWVADHLRLPTIASAPASGPSPAASEAAVSNVITETVVGVAEPVMPEGAASGALETVHSAPAETGVTAAPQPAAAPAAVATSPATPASASTATGALQLRATSESWVEVLDQRGVSLFSRMLQPGETVGLDGVSPLRVKIGNAAATEVTYKGSRVDLAPVTSRGNVAKLELK